MNDKEIKPLEPGRYIGTFLDSEVGISQIRKTPYRRYRFLVEGHIISYYQMEGSHLPLEPGSQYSVMVRNEKYEGRIFHRLWLGKPALWFWGDIRPLEVAV